MSFKKPVFWQFLILSLQTRKGQSFQAQVIFLNDKKLLFHPSRRKKSIGAVPMRPQTQKLCLVTTAQRGGMRHLQAV